MLPDHLNDSTENASATFHMSLWIEVHCAPLTSHEPFSVLVVTSSLQLNIHSKFATVTYVKGMTFELAYLQGKALRIITVYLFFSHS